MSMLSELFRKLEVDTPKDQFHYKNVQNFFEKQRWEKQRSRMDELGRKFMSYGDYSAQGLQRFAKENGLSIEELKELATIVKAFGMYAKDVKPGERVEILKEGNKWKLPADTMIQHDGKGGWKIKTRPDKKGMERLNIYPTTGGPGRRVTIPTGEDYIPPEGFGLTKGKAPEPTPTERLTIHPQDEDGQARRVSVPLDQDYTPPTGMGLTKQEKEKPGTYLVNNDTNEVEGPFSDKARLQALADGTHSEKGQGNQEPSKPDLTPAQAMKRRSNIRKAIATLEKTSTIDAFIAQQVPELAGMIGKELDPQLKQDLMDAWTKELRYLETLISDDRWKIDTDPDLGLDIKGAGFKTTSGGIKYKIGK